MFKPRSEQINHRDPINAERQSRNRTARSVWSASRLAGAFDHETRTKAGASSAHSKRFATHHTPGKPSQFRLEFAYGRGGGFFFEPAQKRLAEVDEPGLAAAFLGRL